MKQQEYLEQMIGRQAFQISLLAANVDELMEANERLTTQLEVISNGVSAPCKEDTR